MKGANGARALYVASSLADNMVEAIGIIVIGVMIMYGDPSPRALEAVAAIAIGKRYLSNTKE